MEDLQRKRELRVLSNLDEILETTAQLEYDLNYLADYIGNDKLFGAKKHTTGVYHIVKQVMEDLK